MVGQVMETDAFQLPDDIFLATHYPMKVYIEDSREGGGIPIPVSERDFLNRFFAPEDYCLVVVLGSAGSGKSHLIRWMSANIPANDKRQVIRVPKSGISLRKVIELILDQVNNEHFNMYRDRLEKATGNLTQHQARELLLNDLAMAVGPNGMLSQGSLTDIEEYLVQSLPSLLYDQHFRNFFLRDKGVIHELVLHILGDSEQVERREERRGFKVSDLPINFSDIQKAGAAARDFYTQLVVDEEIKSATVEWLNKCLNEAISRLLNFSGNDLMELMFDVRKELGKQDVELIILIEDLARLQGIDSQLIDALLERRIAADGTQLCVMRTAMAATTGFFERSVDTTRHRFDFRVYLDLPNQNSLMTTDDMVALASLYLNAVRLSKETIQNWYKDSVLLGKSSAINNACTDCEYKEQCQNAFGASDGIGLYPFTSIAVTTMFNRVTDKGFNPRLLITDVLKHTLYNYGEHIKIGQFPSLALLQHFGGLKMSALMRTDIERKDPINGPRRQVLMELWTDGSKLVNLNHGIHQAFTLPELGDVSQVINPEVTINPVQGKGDTTAKSGQMGQTVGTELPTRIKEFIKQLDNWQNGDKPISQNLAQELRTWLYSAITEYIDWDANLILKSDFIGPSKPFQQRGIAFLNQGTQEGRTAVPLRIPLNNTIETDDVLALQGMVLYNHYKHWNFPNGAEYFLAYAGRLESWSQYVLKQLRSSASLKDEWDPVPAIVELLVVTLLMSGTKVDSTDKVSLINNLFVNLGTVDTAKRTKEWQELYEVLERNQSSIKRFLLPWIACTKGQRNDVQMIDVVQLIKPIRNLRNNNWVPLNNIPEDLRNEYRVLYQTHKKVQEALPKIIDEEHTAYTNWAKAITTELGEDYGNAAIIQVKDLIEQVKKTGISPWRSLDRLEEVIKDFKRSRRQGVIEHAKKLESSDENRKLLPLLGQVDVKAVKAIDTFVNEVNTFLEAVENRLQTDEANLSMDEQQLSNVQLEIADNLVYMRDALENDISKLV